jgi:hypothetical protein
MQDPGKAATQKAKLLAVKKPRKTAVPPALRAYLRKLGAKGGTAAAGAGGRTRWADVSVEERSRRMRELISKRWAKTKRAKQKP